MSSIYLIEPSRWEGGKERGGGGEEGKGVRRSENLGVRIRGKGGRCAREGKEKDRTGNEKEGANEGAAGCWVT